MLHMLLMLMLMLLMLLLLLLLRTDVDNMRPSSGRDGAAAGRVVHGWCWWNAGWRWTASRASARAIDLDDAGWKIRHGFYFALSSSGLALLDNKRCLAIPMLTMVVVVDGMGYFSGCGRDGRKAEGKQGLGVRWGAFLNWGKHTVLESEALGLSGGERGGVGGKGERGGPSVTKMD